MKPFARAGISDERRRAILGYTASLGAAFCYGSVTLVGQKIVSDYSSPMVATSFSMILGTIMVAAIFQRQIRSDFAARAPRKAWMFVALAGCASAWGVSFWYLAIGVAPIVLVAPLVGVSPIVSIALTHLFLQRMERVTWRTVIGALLIVCGVTLVIIGSQL